LKQLKRMRKAKKSTVTIFKYFIELLIVAFGVFLGMFVSDWNIQKKTNQNIDKTLTFIISEIDSNIDKLENSIEYQTKIISSFDSVVNVLEETDLEIIYYKNKKFRFNDFPGWQGFRFSSLENIMYESAKINGVLQELNITTTQLIARIYQKQESYLEFARKVNNKLLTINSKTKVIDVMGTFELVKYDILSTEKWLLKELGNTKEELENIIQSKNYGNT